MVNLEHVDNVDNVHCYLWLPYIIYDVVWNLDSNESNFLEIGQDILKGATHKHEKSFWVS